VNAKTASNPLLDTANVDFEPQMGIGNHMWIVRVESRPILFPTTVTSSQQKIARAILPAVN
jgi:hypothetical protein